MKIIGNIRIKGGKIKHLDAFIENLTKFKNLPENDGMYGEISIETHDKGIRYHRHKYYRGYLLPPISAEAFDGNMLKAHIELKRMFLYNFVTALEEIPQKHRDRCIIEYNTWQEDGKPRREPCGWIPSMANLTDREAIDFVKKVENFAFTDLQVAITSPEAKYHRNKGFGIEEEGGDEGMVVDAGELFPAGKVLPAGGKF